MEAKSSTRARSSFAKPVRKVTAAGLGGAIATVIVWALKEFTNVDITPDVAAALAAIIAFAAGYMTAAGEGEVIEA